ncbi:hypothetical protein DFP73DRAFT_630366 [Morchella snyderi]|nr:hypothetical protein DFP73DRAFT_630366 [Morchella snyderi]
MATVTVDEKPKTTTQEPESERTRAQNTRKSGLIGLVLGTNSSATTFLRPFWPLADFLQSWGILIIHLIFVALLTTCILLWVSDLRVSASNKRSTTSRVVYAFGDYKTMDKFSVKDWILPGDVTTIVSTGLVFIKLATGSWSGLAAWRCACIMLEKKSLTFSEIKFIVSYKMGIFPREKYSWATLIILLLLLPAQLSSPLVSGSISWKQSVGFIHKSRDLQVYPSSGGSLDLWKEYVRDGDTRERVETEAVSFSWSLYHESRTSEGENAACRRPISNKQLTDSSVVNSITIPCLRIDSIVWEQNPASEQTKSMFSEPYRGVLPAIKERPITHPVVGNAGMLDVTVWDNNSAYHSSYPTPSIFNETRLLAFVFATLPVNSTETCTEKLGAEGAVFQRDKPEKSSGCYTIARVSFTAGVTIGEAKVVSPGVVQGSNSVNIVANEFTTESILLMNDVMHGMALGDPEQSVSDHTTALIMAMQRAYVASWNSLQYNFGEDGGTRSQNDLLGASARQRIDLLQGVVSYWRVWVWVGLQLLVTLSAILLQCFENHWKVRNDKKRERTFVADALLLDTTTVFEVKNKRRNAREGPLENVRDSLDINTPLRVRLKKNDSTGSYMLAVHPDHPPPAVVRDQT